MIRSLLVAVALVAISTTAVLADSPATPTLPVGITVYVDASATTSDVDASFTATKMAKNAYAGAAAYGAAKSAAGSTVTVDDLGVSAGMMGMTETVRVSGTPAAVDAARAKLTAAGLAVAATGYSARDQTGLQSDAYAKATKMGRTIAEAAASADGRHIGRLLNIAPSPLAMLGDITGLLGKLPQMQMLMDGSTGPSATAHASGYYTFELLP